jgi:cytoskeletal protein CcmA (bactofilin family)
MCNPPSPAGYGQARQFQEDCAPMTTIGPSLTVTGDITSNEDITVHGTVKGTISMQQGALVIAPAGKAEANLEGSKITVHGTVSGDLTVTERLELADTAHVNGTINAPSIVLRDGAMFNGIIDMATKKAAKPKLVEQAQKAS